MRNYYYSYLLQAQFVCAPEMGASERTFAMPHTARAKICVRALPNISQRIRKSALIPNAKLLRRNCEIREEWRK